MASKGKILILFVVVLVCFALPLFAADMSQGLKCPSGWTNNRSSLGNDLIKQCISPGRDAVIELYAAPGRKVPLGQLIDLWTKKMNQRGMPFQNFVSEVPGQVSGHSALTRTYSGSSGEGVQFDSHIVASRYNGVNYIFQGLCVKGQHQRWKQHRHTMNTWYYPGASKHNTNKRKINNYISKSAPNGKPTISGMFIADRKEYIGGKFHYRVYRFNEDHTYTTGLKNVATGKLKMNTRKKNFRIDKGSSKGKYFLNSGRSCTEGYITNIVGNDITRFKSGCYTSGGKGIYLNKVNTP